MPLALTHEQCRKDMCCACGGRAGKRNITPELGERIRKWAQPTWNADVVSHPVGICDTCRSRLLDCEREQTVNLKGRPGTQLRWSSFKLEDISVARGQKADSCSCKICRARKTNCAGFGPSVKNVKIETRVNENTEIHCKNKDEISEKSCSKCFQKKIGRGIPHQCTEARKKQNIVNIVNENECKEQIVSAVLKSVVEEKNHNNVKKLN